MKKKPIFDLPFVGLQQEEHFPILYHENGHYSVVFKIDNNITRYNGDIETYSNYHDVFTNIIKSLGSGYHVQKTDFFTTEKLSYNNIKEKDFLSTSYFSSFEGRDFKNINTYLIITKITKRSTYIKFDKKGYDLFNTNIEKLYNILSDKNFNPVIQGDKEIRLLLKRILAFNFKDDTFSIGNLKVNDEFIELSDNRIFRSTSLIDIDEVQLPQKVEGSRSLNNLGYQFPTDSFSFLYDLSSDVVIYNQVFEINDQMKERRVIEQKRDRHKSMPDPANDLAVKDIEGVLNEIVENQELLINCHFSINLIDTPEKVTSAYNDCEAKLFEIGIVPSKRTFNQLEVLSSIIPGNTTVLQEYDFFKTTLSPALCFLYKENLLKTEESDFLLYFSNREGIPVGIDISDKPKEENIIGNRNKFVLGPSGSGKSFFMNHMMRQYLLYDTDVVLVDVGHSYSGLCAYYGGKYITYTQENPITMNPFFVRPEEINQEKKDSLKSLIGLLWKQVDGHLDVVEETVLSETINAYYDDIYSKQKIDSLSFNSFYDFSLIYIDNVIKKNNIVFNLSDYKYILKRFYRGGEFENLLNASMDSSLFQERLIVFEIDSIKDNKVLFPIVTLIIMDVFIQKMRLKDNRKCLIIEEAWKAIASPMMADYILYLYKTVRKFFGEAMLVTQELDDILKSETLKNSVINNSDTIILLDQAKFKDTYDEIAKLLSINEVERNKIFTMNRLQNKDNRGKFKEVYISIGGKGEVYGVEVSLKEYLTFTTELKEKEAIQKYSKKFGSISEGLKQFEVDFLASRLSLPKFISSIS